MSNARPSFFLFDVMATGNRIEAFSAERIIFSRCIGAQQASCRPGEHGRIAFRLLGMHCARNGIRY
jgi:hypothetical protein